MIKDVRDGSGADGAAAKGVFEGQVELVGTVAVEQGKEPGDVAA